MGTRRERRDAVVALPLGAAGPAVVVAWRGEPAVMAAGESEKVVAAYGLSGFPFAGVVAGLFVVVLLRAQATYWLGRALSAGTVRAGVAERVGRRLSGPRLDRAVSQIERWGPIAVTLCFLTVGVQTVVNLAAGLTRMSYPRYTAAMIPGCVAWAFIYATIGLTAFYAAVGAAAGSPVALALLVGVAVLVFLLVRRRRERARATNAGL